MSNVIQDYTSLMNIYQLRFGHHSSKVFGDACFFTETIPLVYDCVAVSQFILDMLYMVIRKKPRNRKIHVYEFGFGSGLVAKRTMDWIMETDPELYRRIVYHLSDISSEQVNRVRKKPFWKTHRRRMRFEVMDLRQPKFKPDEQPDLVFHTYLLDALDYRMIQIKDGVVSEVEIQSTLPESFCLPDTRSFPPDTFSSEDIRQMLESSPIDAQRLVVERRIFDTIERQFRTVPLEQQHGIPEAEKAAIRGYIDETEITEGAFVFSMNALECIRDIVRAMPPESLLLMMDYTTDTDLTDVGEYEELLSHHFSRHGMHLYFAVAEDMMKYFLSSSCNGTGEFWRLISDDAFMRAHCLSLFYRGEQPKVLDSILQSRFPFRMDIIGEFPTELFSGRNGDSIAPLTELANWTHHSPYHILWASCEEFMDQDPERVVALLDLLDEQFGEPNPKTLLLRAKLEVHRGNPGQALEILDGLVKSIPLFEDPHVERVAILSEMTEKSRLIQAFREWISVTSRSGISGMLMELVKLYHQTGNSRMANRIVRHIADQNIIVEREV